MKPDVQLPTIFTDCNVCMLEAHVFRERRVPPRTIGSRFFSTTLSAMQSHTLSLRLDNTLHNFEEARGAVRYLGSDPQFALNIECCAPPRVIGIRKIITARALTLMLIDELLGKPIGVIGESLEWRLEGLDVCFVTGRDEVVV
jgi:hypothetical protein